MEIAERKDVLQKKLREYLESDEDLSFCRYGRETARRGRAMKKSNNKES